MVIGQGLNNLGFWILRKVEPVRWTGSPACSRSVSQGEKQLALRGRVLRLEQTFLGVASPFGRRRILDFRFTLSHQEIQLGILD
ncbi:hypothetical protein H6G35_09920 [Aulosira sp. FACHB-113]|uniref:hypothetical protein n=1 Tax=Tolypothrix tenuis TaxID=457083 RepID=UPI0016820A3A|nr:hypothetical protein [Aulosira sp. FACHB-113]